MRIGFRLPAFGFRNFRYSDRLGSWLARELLFYDYESTAELRSPPRRSPMVSNDFFGLMTTSALFPGRTAKPHRFAQTPLHAVALDRAAESAAYGESDAQARDCWSFRRLCLRPLK